MMWCQDQHVMSHCQFVELQRSIIDNKSIYSTQVDLHGFCRLLHAHIKILYSFTECMLDKYYSPESPILGGILEWPFMTWREGL